MFFEGEAKQYQAYQTIPNLYLSDLCKWETIQKIGFDKVVELVESWEETEKFNKEISTFNYNLKTAATTVLIQFFKELKLPHEKKSVRNKFLGYTKEFSTMLAQLTKKYNTVPPTKLRIHTITYNGNPLACNGDSLKLLKEAKLKMELSAHQEEKKTNRFKTALKIAFDNQINIVDCPTEASVIATVDEFMKEKFIEENYSNGTEVYLKHTCDECSTWYVGERRCSCGNVRVELEVEGNFIDGYYAYPVRY